MTRDVVLVFCSTETYADLPTRSVPAILTALSIITDSEEKRHGGTSQEVSQEVWEKGGE